MKYILIIAGVVGVLYYAFDWKTNDIQHCKNNVYTCVEAKEVHKLVWE